MDDNRDGPLVDPPAQLQPFIRGGRITAVPARHTRRRLLLDQVAQAFEPGRRYPERVVNEILKPLFDDYCALRRYLVDEDFLSRTPAGVYWRAGAPSASRPVSYARAQRQLQAPSSKARRPRSNRPRIVPGSAMA